MPADRDVGDPPLASAEFLVDGPPLADEFDNHAHHDPGAYAGQGMGAGESRRPMSAVSGRSFDHVYHGARKHSADAVLSGARRGMFTEGLDVSEALPEPDIAAPSRRGSLAFQIDVVGGSDDDGRDGAGVGVGVGAGAGMGAGAGAGTGAGLGAVEAPHKLDQRDTIYVDQGSSEASDHAQETQHDQWHHEPHLLHPHHHHHSMATTAAGSDVRGAAAKPHERPTSPDTSCFPSHTHTPTAAIVQRTSRTAPRAGTPEPAAATGGSSGGESEARGRDGRTTHRAGVTAGGAGTTAVHDRGLNELPITAWR